MNKFLIATSALFFATQPLKAGWLSSHDYSIQNDFIEGPDDPGSFPHRQISYHFGREKPESKSERYSQVAKINAQSEIEMLYKKGVDIDLSFSGVSTQDQVEIIRNVIDQIDLGTFTVDVSFKDNVSDKVTKLWNEIWSEKEHCYQAFLEERNQRRLDRQQQYNDFADSHSEWEADIMDQEGYFGTGSHNYTSEDEDSE